MLTKSLIVNFRKQAKASIIFGFLPIIIQELSLSARILVDICITHIYAY